jgi:hypothetical protein
MRPRVSRSAGATLALLSLAVLIVAACTGGAGATHSGGPSSTPDRRSPDGSVLPSLPAGVDVPGELLTALITDASERSGVPPSAVSVVSGTSVTWNDGSWGCPKRGVLYTQALVQGYQVVIEAGGQRIDYRAVGPDSFRICEGLTGG